MRQLILRETRCVAGRNDTLEVYKQERGWQLQVSSNGASRSYPVYKWQRVEHTFLAFRNSARSRDR